MITTSPTLPVEAVSTDAEVPIVVESDDATRQDPAPVLSASPETSATPYLPLQSSQQASELWHQIQAGFVDDPRQSVAQAHALVGELMQRIVDSFANERSNLEQQWSRGDNVSTEDLRVCLQRYRAFFSPLLPSVGAS